MENIKFSICIPNYNYANYIGETINSVLSQTYQNYEIIIIDNASTDDSLSVIKSFNDSRIKVFENVYNIGFSPNLDRATERAEGDYIILLSSDDIMKEDALHEYNSIINLNKKHHPNIVIFAASDVIDGDDAIFGKKNAKTTDVENYINEKNISPLNSNNEEFEIYAGHDLLRGVLTANFQPLGQFLTTCYSKELYNKIEGYNNTMRIFPDAHFSHKLAFQNPKLIYTKKNLFSYRIHYSNQNKSSADTQYLFDNFQFTLSYPQKDLQLINLDEVELKRTFIKNCCLKMAFTYLLTGYPARAFKYFIFGFSTYPDLMFKNILTYLFFPIFIFCPFFYLVRITYKNIFKRK